MLRGDARRPAVVAALSIGAFAAVAAAAACGASDEAASAGTSGGSADAATGDTGVGPFADAGAVPISANGLVLVHAASFPAFRICFDGTPLEQPIPATDLMPSSNLPGVDVGAAIRLAPRRGPLGRAFVYAEEKIRHLYFNSPSAGPSCGSLLSGQTAGDAIQVASDLPDVSTGVHLLVLRGCANIAIDPEASAARCGPGWTPATGNLALTDIRVEAFTRPSMSNIPVQIVQLSLDLQAQADTRLLGLAFGPLEAGAPPPFVEGAVPSGTAVPNPPAVLDTAAVELSDFATSGVFVTLGGPVDAGPEAGDAGDADAGPRDVVLTQSLADIQRKSSPRSLPPDWFATASSYVLLSVGEIDPKNSDGGPGDPRRGLHLLAVPLVVPDAGTPPVIVDASASD